MKDWKLIAKAHRLDISEQEVERIQPSLDTLEAAFRPLIKRIRLDVEPALIFRCVREESR